MATANNSLIQGKKNVPFTVAIQGQGIQRMLQASFSTPQAITKFTADLMAAVTSTPGLKDCEPASIVSAGLQCAALNLSTSPAVGEAWIVPYGNKATFQIGKNGLVQLAIRSGQYKDIDTIEVRQGEYKGRDKETGKPRFEFIEDDEVRESLPIVGYLAYLEMLNGFKKSVYFSKDKMLKWAARYSPAFKVDMYKKYVQYQATGEGLTDSELRQCSSPWYERFDSMAEKTVLRQLLQKWGVKSRDMVQALEQDMQAESAGGQFFEATGQIGTEGEPDEQGQKGKKQEPPVEDEFFG